MGGPPPIAPAAAGLAPDVIKLVQEFVNTVVLHPAVKSYLTDVAENVVPGITASYLQLGVDSRSALLRRLAESRQQVVDQAGPQLAIVAAKAIEALFGVTVTPAEVQASGQSGISGGYAPKLADAVLKGLFGTIEAQAGMTPEQGFANVKRVISLSLGQAVEGWWGSTINLGFLGNDMPNVADLDDLVANAIGLGRLSRRALAPLLNALVVEPAAQYVNKTYLPALPNESTAARLANRGRIDDEEYFSIMAKRGWTRSMAAELRILNSAQPARDDLRSMLEMGQIETGDVELILEGGGMAEWAAKLVSKNIEQDRVRALRNQIATTARSMFAARETTIEELQRTLDQVGYTELESQYAVALGLAEQSRPTRLTRATMEDAYVAEIVQLEELQLYYRTEPYSPRDVEILTALVLQKKLVADEKAARAKPKLPIGASQPLTRSELAELHRRGILTTEGYKAELIALGFKDAPLTALLAVAVQKRDEYVDALKRHLAAAAGVTTATTTIDHAFVRGLVFEDALRAAYVAAGYAPAHVELLVRLRRLERNDYLAAQLKAAQAAAAANTRARA